MPTTGPGTKVRLAGCVNRYDVSSGTIDLASCWPCASEETRRIDISNLASALSHDLVQTGVWINVMGYIHTHDRASHIPQKVPYDPALGHNYASVHGNAASVGGMEMNVNIVQATAIWAMGPVMGEKVRQWTEVVKGRREAMRLMTLPKEAR
ncbi:MAG: hypothetical protein Q9159_007307 [Coniocarpon cinnabarinum]